MAKPSKKTRRRKAPPRPGKSTMAAPPRRKTADRRLRILERLISGLSVAHIARVENLTIRRVQQIIAAMLDSRDIDPPAGFVQLQIARLSQAMIVTHTMMMEGDLQAVDRMIKLTAELDRYHGFTPALTPGPTAPRLAAPAPGLISQSTSVEGEAKFSASQTLQITQNREGIADLAEP